MVTMIAGCVRSGMGVPVSPQSCICMCVQNFQAAADGRTVVSGAFEIHNSILRDKLSVHLTLMSINVGLEGLVTRVRVKI